MFDVREIDGKAQAVLRCDLCGRVIQHYRDGMAVYDDEWGVGFVHKLPPGANSKPIGKIFDLDIYFFFLCAALGVDMERAKEKARELKMI